MCEAYDAEWSYIKSMEHRAAIDGFFAAMDGKLRHENPHIDSPFQTYMRDAWNHGWGCFMQDITNPGHKKLLPWPIESQFSYADRVEIREYFERTGKFRKAWRKNVE